MYKKKSISISMIFIKLDVPFLLDFVRLIVLCQLYSKGDHQRMEKLVFIGLILNFLWDYSTIFLLSCFSPLQCSYRLL